MVLLFLWLAFLTNLSHADGNYLAHAYERLWLWERYQIAMWEPPPRLTVAPANITWPSSSIEGAEKQQDIFPFQRKRGGDTGRDNRGSGRKSTLSYSEFMWRLSDKSIEHDLPVPQLKRPKSAKAIHDAAVELVDKKLTGNLKPVDIDPGLLTGDDPKKDDSDPHRGQMSLLFDKLQLKLSMWRIKGEHANVIDPRLGKLKEISKAVLKLRREDSQRYVVKLFKKPINKDGLGLDEDDVVTETKTSRVITGPEYEEVMVAETFSNNKDQLLKRFGNEEDLRDWVSFAIWLPFYRPPEPEQPELIQDAGCKSWQPCSGGQTYIY